MSLLEKKKITEKLTDISLYEIFENKFISDKNNFLYFSSCGIIDKKIFNLFYEIKIDLNISLNIKGKNIYRFKCLFGDNKIFKPINIFSLYI